MARYNLDTIIGKCVHRPIALKDPDMLPLYKRNDGIFNADGSVGTRSEAWMKASETTYSSPNNIRRVFITYEGVYVHMYKPIKGAGADTMKYYAYSSVNKDFKPLELWKTCQFGSVYKTGFGAFKGQWSCSNIEEIWFDWTILMSADIQGLFGNCMQMMTREGTVGIQDGSLLQTIFNRFCLKPGENLSKTFPRLKIIGYMDKLGIVYNAIKYKPGEDSVTDFEKLWMKNSAVISAINSPKIYVAVYKVPNVSALNNKFITRSFYSYDKEILEGYFENLKQRMLKYSYDKRTGKEGKTPETKKIEKSEFEKVLENIERTRGIEKAKKTFKLMTENDKDGEMIESLTPECRARYLGGRV